MKSLFTLLLTLFWLTGSIAFAQTYTSNPALNTYTSCTSATQPCNNISYLNDVVKVQLTSAANGTFGFEVAKCNNGRFSTNGTLYIKDAVCGTILNGSGKSYVGSATTGPTSLTETVSVAIPAGASQSFYAITIGVDGTRTYAGPITVTAIGQPNLNIPTATVNPQTDVLAGTNVTATYTLKNAGTATAGNSVVKFYLSKSSALTSSSVYLAETAIGSISASGSNPLNKVLTIPENTTSGSYYIIFASDANDQVIESSEFDNKNFEFLTIITPQLPDLVANSVTFGSASAKPGEMVNVSYIVKNQGGGNAGTSKAYVWLSTDQTKDPNDFFLGNSSVAALNANASVNLTTACTIPASLAAGTYYVIVGVDTNVQVGESNEDNNHTTSASKITINGSTPCLTCLTPELAVTSFPVTDQEGLCAAQYLCSKGIIRAAQNVTGYTPSDKLRRDDAANMLVKSLLQDSEITVYSSISFPTDSYHTPFDDINNSSATDNYNRAAKVLLYLFYADDATFTTPFRKSGVYFYPQKGIARIDFLKLLCEAFNISTAVATTVPQFTDISQLTTKEIAYLKKGLDLSVITNQSLFRPYDEIKREEAFLMLQRLRTHSSVNIPGRTKLENSANYLFEQNVTHDNVSIMRSMASGNFAYSEHGFSLPDIGLPLSFGFTYSSVLTDWPDAYRTIEPLGAGWTHNFNSYIIQTETAVNGSSVVEGEPLLLLANGDGTFHTYKNNNPDSPVKRSIDNFNTLKVIKNGSTITGYEVTRVDLVRFLYEKIVTDVNEDFFRLTKIIDRYNNTITLSYEPIATRTPANPVKYRLKTVTGQSGRKVTFEYDNKDLLWLVKFPGENANDERSIRFSFYPAWDEPKSDRLQRFYSAKHSTGVATKSTLYEYGSVSENKGLIITAIKRPKGNTIKLAFDNKKRLTSTEEVAGSESLGKTVYDRDNVPNCPAGINCTKVTGQDKIDYIYKTNNNGVDYEISSQTITLQRPENDVNPSTPAWFKVNGLKNEYNYNAQGQVLVNTTFDKNGNIKFIERWLYNEQNNEVAQYWEPNSNGNGEPLIKYNYSADGKYLQNVVQTVNATTLLTTTYQQHPNGKLEYLIDNEGLRTNYYYDGQWNNNRVEYVPLGLNSSAEYDFSGRIKNSTNAKNQKSFVKFDHNDNIVETTAPAPLSYVTQIKYDDNDNTTEIINAKGKNTLLTYDRYDRDSTITFEGATQKYYYNNDQNSVAYGKITQLRKPAYNQQSNPDLNRKFDYVYDDQGFLKSNGYITDIVYNKTATNAEKNTLISIKGGSKLSDLQNLKDFQYDELVRLSQYTDHYGNTVKYRYDNNGNIIFIIYPNLKVVEYQYDRIGRLRKVIWQTATVAEYVYTGSRLDYVQYGNAVRTKYEYDAAGRLKGMTTKKNSGTGDVIAAYTFDFDNLGNHSGETITEPYAQPTLPATATTYTYNDANQIKTAGSISFTHDGDGNVITKGGVTYTYDKEDNLISVVGNGLNLTFEHDAFGNRRKAVRNGTDTRYILDILGLDDVLAETDANNTLQHYYIHGLGLIARVKPDGNTLHYYHGDFRGSVVAMTDANQTITHKYQYDDFGNIINSQEIDYNPSRYVGLYGIMYETPDLAYIRARYYDPTTGRFNSTDPIWSTNLYPYSNNNGVMNVDVNGLQSTPINTADAVYERVEVSWIWGELINQIPGQAGSVISKSAGIKGPQGFLLSQMVGLTLKNAPRFQQFVDKIENIHSRQRFVGYRSNVPFGGHNYSVRPTQPQIFRQTTISNPDIKPDRRENLPQVYSCTINSMVPKVGVCYNPIAKTSKSSQVSVITPSYISPFSHTVINLTNNALTNGGAVAIFP